MKSDDNRIMRKALELSVRGFPSPNPYVGCILVKDGTIIGQGYHACCGHDHAETSAIKDARRRGNGLSGSTMYVTLEPCCHHGRTSPCTDRIIKEGIKEVHVALQDPDPRVSGRGMSQLRGAGIKVHTGLLEEQAKEINEIYLKYITTRKPFILMKTAVTLDGMIATKYNDSKWISNEKSRRYSRGLRSGYDAILVGINTVLKDDPKLTSGIRGRRDPLRIVADSRLRIPLDAKVLKDDNAMIATTERCDDHKKKALRKLGIKCIVCGREKVNFRRLMDKLGKMNITSVLVEGGSSINASILKENIADKIIIFIAPKLAGGDAIPMIAGLGIDKIKDSIQVKSLKVKRFDGDVMIQGYLR